MAGLYNTSESSRQCLCLIKMSGLVGLCAVILDRLNPGNTGGNRVQILAAVLKIGGAIRAHCLFDGLQQWIGSAGRMVLPQFPDGEAAQPSIVDVIYLRLAGALVIV